VVVAAALGLIFGANSASATVSARFSSAFPMGQGTLRVESDGGDAITLACSDGFVVVNGRAPDTGPVACSRANTIEVVGGPGDNVITVSGSLPAGTYGVFRGTSGSTSIEAGSGDDVVIGPTSGFARLEGGAGDDVLEGRALDRYVFGSSDTPELDTIVETQNPACNPSFFESNQHGLSYWTVPWDAADFTSLPATDPITLDAASPGGIFAVHRNRTIRLERSGYVAVEAVAGGAGNDVLSGACLTLGGAGDDRLAGGKEGDLLLGGPGDDMLDGRAGIDTLDGGSGDDRLAGGSGADALAGRQGNDASAGGAGSDVYLFEAASGVEAELVTEGRTAGVDVLSFTLPTEVAVDADLGARGRVVASARGLTVRTRPGDARLLEGVIGSAGADRMEGNDGPNHFWSGGGSDRVAGGRGNDVYHVDWAASMPYGAYGFWDVWRGPFERGSFVQRSPGDPETELPLGSVLRVAERPRQGIDTLDLAESWFSSPGVASRLDGHVRGARVDLSAHRQIMRTRWVRVVAAQPGTAANLERVRGTTARDVLIGNAAANELEGRHSRDLVVGRGGRDTCITYRREDVLRDCERVRPRDPDE
jgi:Ca2+-binding RTX toxin-like protein